jgi:hypothetical protein
VTRYGRARKVEGSVVQTRPPQPHPDAGRDTRRMPFEQLRSLVVSLISTESGDDGDPVAEFETQQTTCLPGPRTSTLDQLIAWLKAAPSLPNKPSRPRTHREVERLPARDRRR